ncbi:MAG: hypothetical protein M3506_09685 [Chloroflexota bacterium]|nr:hypothetical protein [Chloroflexota bacterium]
MSRLSGASLLFGIAFGFLFAAAGFNQYVVVHATLLLEYLDPFFVMGSSVATSMVILWFLERRGWTTPLGGALTLRRWPVERKHVYGGMVFGTGWAIVGACPGTVSTMLAAGSVLGVVPLAGLLAGILLRDRVVERPQRASREPTRTATRITPG